MCVCKINEEKKIIIIIMKIILEMMIEEATRVTVQELKTDRMKIGMEKVTNSCYSCNHRHPCSVSESKPILVLPLYA